MRFKIGDMVDKIESGKLYTYEVVRCIEGTWSQEDKYSLYNGKRYTTELSSYLIPHGEVPDFLVVLFDLWNNKTTYSASCGELGDIIRFAIANNSSEEFADSREIDYESYNLSNPRDISTFGEGFYDIDIPNDDEEYNDLEYDLTTVMIFEIPKGRK